MLGGIMELSKRLQYIRKIRGFTQQDIADRFYISRQAIQKWESGETAPDISKLHELSIIYNISIDVLLDITLNDKQFKNEVIYSKFNSEHTTNNIVNLIRNPNEIDLVITGTIIFSTVIVLFIVHLIGVVLVILSFLFNIFTIISSAYFLINAIMNLNAGISTFLVNLGFSILSAGVFLLLYNYIFLVINKYIFYVKKITNRLRIYKILFKRIHNENK